MLLLVLISAVFLLAACELIAAVLLARLIDTDLPEDLHQPQAGDCGVKQEVL
jgi:hypothetical protein